MNTSVAEQTAAPGPVAHEPPARGVNPVAMPSNLDLRPWAGRYKPTWPPTPLTAVPTPALSCILRSARNGCHFTTTRSHRIMVLRRRLKSMCLCCRVGEKIKTSRPMLEPKYVFIRAGRSGPLWGRRSACEPTKPTHWGRCSLYERCRSPAPVPIYGRKFTARLPNCEERIAPGHRHRVAAKPTVTERCAWSGNCQCTFSGRCMATRMGDLHRAGVAG